jgi:hypothetical protein
MYSGVPAAQIAINLDGDGRKSMSAPAIYIRTPIAAVTGIEPYVEDAVLHVRSRVQ